MGKKKKKWQLCTFRSCYTQKYGGLWNLGQAGIRCFDHSSLPLSMAPSCHCHDLLPPILPWTFSSAMGTTSSTLLLYSWAHLLLLWWPGWALSWQQVPPHNPDLVT